MAKKNKSVNPKLVYAVLDNGMKISLKNKEIAITKTIQLEQCELNEKVVELIHDSDNKCVGTFAYERCSMYDIFDNKQRSEVIDVLNSYDKGIIESILIETNRGYGSNNGSITNSLFLNEVIEKCKTMDFHTQEKVLKFLNTI